MIVAERQRAERRDAGVPRMTARDSLALEWLAQMYGAPQDLVAQMLGCSMSRAYATVARWRQLRQVDVAAVDAGHRWVYPTQKAANGLLGWDAAWWRPRLSTAAHTRAVAQARLAFCGAGDALTLDGWVGERRLRHDVGWRHRGQELPHVPDGLLTLPNGQAARVEVELTPKALGRTAEVMKALGDGPVVYLVTPASQQTVVRALGEYETWARSAGGDASHIRVLSLEEVTACRTPDAAWSLLLGDPSGGRSTGAR